MPFDGASPQRTARTLRVVGLAFSALVFAGTVWLGLLILFLM